ncbi:MAG: hypothetical protein LC751_09840, partial [Actinobacteria bacterium]|nr:hypothetical protein [Actinomycetota bacterium]
MPRYLEILSRPLTVLLVLGIVIIVNGFLFYRYQVKLPDSDEASSGDKETTSAAGPSTESGGARYVENVGDIQNDAVQIFTRINDMVGRYDTLTVDDVETIDANRLALETYSAQAEDLDIPEEYKGQHELFSGAIGDLYAAAEIAQRVTTAPTSATPADFKEYDNRVAEATSGLK